VVSGQECGILPLVLRIRSIVRGRSCHNHVAVTLTAFDLTRIELRSMTVGQVNEEAIDKQLGEFRMVSVQFNL
jgi:hypothetical protein